VVYQLPFGKGHTFLKSGIAGAVLGGWQIGGVLRYKTGVPISFGCAQGIPGWDNCIRFDRVQGQQIFSQAYLSGRFDPFDDRQFNPAAFADPNASRTPTSTYRFGNYPRNNGDARAPNYYNEDFSIIRNFAIREPVSLQLKAELLNAFNRHIFQVGNTNPNDPDFGLIDGTIDAPRVVQFTLRLNF